MEKARASLGNLFSPRRGSSARRASAGEASAPAGTGLRAGEVVDARNPRRRAESATTDRLGETQPTASREAASLGAIPVVRSESSPAVAGSSTEPAALKVGDCVRLKNLTKASLNGSTGRLMEYDSEKNRWDVSVDGKILSIKPGNLEYKTDNTQILSVLTNDKKSPTDRINEILEMIDGLHSHGDVLTANEVDQFVIVLKQFRSLSADRRAEEYDKMKDSRDRRDSSLLLRLQFIKLRSPKLVQTACDVFVNKNNFQTVLEQENKGGDTPLSHARKCVGTSKGAIIITTRYDELNKLKMAKYSAVEISDKPTASSSNPVELLKHTLALCEDRLKGNASDIDIVKAFKVEISDEDVIDNIKAALSRTDDTSYSRQLNNAQKEAILRESNDKGETLLSRASRLGLLAIVKCIVQNLFPYDVPTLRNKLLNLKNADEENAADIAAKFGNIQLATYLVDQGVECSTDLQAILQASKEEAAAYEAQLELERTEAEAEPKAVSSAAASSSQEIEEAAAPAAGNDDLLARAASWITEFKADVEDAPPPAAEPPAVARTDSEERRVKEADALLVGMKHLLDSFLRGSTEPTAAVVAQAAHEEEVVEEPAALVAVPADGGGLAQVQEEADGELSGSEDGN